MDKKQLIILSGELESPEYKELIEKQDYPAISALLNERPQIPNPDERPEMSKRLTLTRVFGAAFAADPAGTLNAVAKFAPMLDMAERAVHANDREAMQVHLAIFGSQMSVAAQQALGALLTETEPDPAWLEKVSGESRAEALGLPSVTAADVQAVLT
jgi:hypothetical protein